VHASLSRQREEETTMSAVIERNPSAMLQALHAAGPAQDRSEQMLLYGQFVGSWSGTRVAHEAGGTRRELSAEVHFDWVLEGRAVQDVWIAPARRDGPAAMYGTTLRVYDPQAGHWRIAWIDPLKQIEMRMIGRRVGDEIMQECRTEQGVLRQWKFTEIEPDSFHWLWQDQRPDGSGWDVRVEFFLRRN
jgi:hypothetical protein